MKRYSDTVALLNRNNVLTAAVGANVTVFLKGTLTLATIYVDDGITPAANPLVTDASGRFAFYAADGRYDLTVSGGSIVPFTLGDVEVSDVTEASVTQDATWNIGNANVNAVLTSVGGSLVGTFAGSPAFSGLVTLSGGVGGIGPRFQQFTANGTFNIPANITVLKVTVVGAGGAGGGTPGGGGQAGGGGAGGAAIKWLSGLTPGNTLIVTIGTGGVGAVNANGGNGTASSVTSGTQTIAAITASGGAGAPISSSNFGGGGGVGTGGDLNFGGSNGLPNSNIVSVGNNGGSSILGGGAGESFNGNGAIGSAPGGGGGGAGGVSFAGGAGANGIVIFEWVA